MPLLFLFFLVACLQVHWRPALASLSASEGALATWLAIITVLAATFGLVSAARVMLKRNPGRRRFVARRYLSWRHYNLIATIATFGLSAYLLGWGWLIQEKFGNGAQRDMELPGLLPGAELLIFAPLVFGLLCSWAIFYDLEKALHDLRSTAGSGSEFWSRGAYVAFHARHSLGLACAPLLLLILAKDLPAYIPGRFGDSSLVPQALIIVAAMCLFLGMPWVVRLVLGLRPLPDSPLRDRLVACGQRLKFRAGDILVWDTRGAVANAMVVGIVPWIRFVVFTDRLLTEMSPDEVEAVFGHEVGHVKHRHMLYYLAFFVGSLVVLMQLWDGAFRSFFSNDGGQALGLREAIAYLALRQDLFSLSLLAIVGVYIFLVFGFLSRRCERQADVYACRTVSCSKSECTGHELAARAPQARGLCATGIRTFIQALEKVAILNGISREHPGWLQSWQHSTIAHRVDFLERLIQDRQVDARFQRALAAWKWCSLIVLGAVLFLLGQKWGWSAALSF